MKLFMLKDAEKPFWSPSGKSIAAFKAGQIMEYPEEDAQFLLKAKMGCQVVEKPFTQTVYDTTKGVKA